MAGAQNTREIRLTIDGGLQKTLEGLALDRARALGPDMSVAIMVVDSASGEVLARVASPDYFDERRAGQVERFGRRVVEHRIGLLRLGGSGQQQARPK